MSTNKVLYIPIEESKRDLDVRLLLSILAIEDGWTVVIGQQWLLHAAAKLLPSGVFFFKGANTRQGNWMRHARTQGHRIIAMEEEAVPIAEPFLIKLLMSREAAANIDLFLAQSPYHANLLSDEFPALAQKTKVSGVPRFDLLRPAFVDGRKKVPEGIRSEMGDFLLINTNFGYANTHWKDPSYFLNEVAAGAGMYDASNPEHVSFWERRLAFEQNTIKGFKGLISKLSRRGKVVLRPHIAEDITIWKDLEGQLGGGLVVKRDGAAVDWILASNLLIQNSCTTGLEALILGHATMTYAPFDNGILDTFLGNKVFNPVTDEELALRIMSGGSEGQEFLCARRDLLETYLGEGRGLASVKQWNEIKSNANAHGDVAEQVFSTAWLELENLPDWARKKFDAKPEDLQAGISLVCKGLGRLVPLNGKMLGDGLFALRPA